MSSLEDSRIGRKLARQQKQWRRKVEGRELKNQMLAGLETRMLELLERRKRYGEYNADSRDIQELMEIILAVIATIRK